MDTSITSKPPLPAKPLVDIVVQDLGTITLELYPDKAPLSVENFLYYVENQFYNGLVFHRVIPGFMIQGGGFETTKADVGMKMRPGLNGRAEIQNEANNGLKNDKYAVAMARTSAPHSATSQFFINVADNAFLNHTAPTAQGWGYAVFGKVVEGQEVVDKIAGTSTTRRGFHDDVPVADIVIVSAKLREESETSKE